MANLNLSTFDESIYTKEEIDKYTNEELIDLIHDTYSNNIYWELLWIKTKKCVYKVYVDTVNSYNKDKNSDEIFSVLMQAWVHAVNTYDKNKATDKFYKYAIYIIRQQYSRYASRINTEKTGQSVKSLFLDDLTYEYGTEACDILEVIEDDSTVNLYDKIGNRIDIYKNLEKLKHSMPVAYTYIIEYFFQGKTFLMIAEKYNVDKSTVRRNVKKGLNKLQYYYYMQDQLSI